MLTDTLDVNSSKKNGLSMNFAVNRPQLYQKPFVSAMKLEESKEDFLQPSNCIYSLHHADENELKWSTECSKANPHQSDSKQGISMTMLDVQGN